MSIGLQRRACDRSLRGGPKAGRRYYLRSTVENPNYGELTRALVNWVENGVPPGDITITKRANNSPTGAVQFTTLLCSYPTSLTYLGSGDLLSAASYVCE
jgi:Tannase and feruloyl esterase